MITPSPDPDLAALIDKAVHLAADDVRHLAILESLRRLAERSGIYRPGPRFGLAQHRPRLQADK